MIHGSVIVGGKHWQTSPIKRLFCGNKGSRINGHAVAKFRQLLVSNRSENQISQSQRMFVEESRCTTIDRLVRRASQAKQWFETTGLYLTLS
jgi:hypothetical protein